MAKLTPKAIRVNLNLSREEMAEKFDALGCPMTARKLQERENKNTKWSGLEIMALMTIAKIDDINSIDID